MFSHELRTEIEISSTPERVWQILSDFAAYPKWNPFIRFANGMARENTRLEVRIQPSGAKGMTFRPIVLEATPAKRLRWRGQLLFPGIFDGEHCFAIEPKNSETIIFRHSEQFSGVLIPFFRAQLDRDTKRGFEEMNQALKRRAEV